MIQVADNEQDSVEENSADAKSTTVRLSGKLYSSLIEEQEAIRKKRPGPKTPLHKLLADRFEALENRVAELTAALLLFVEQHPDV